MTNAMNRRDFVGATGMLAMFGGMGVSSIDSAWAEGVDQTSMGQAVAMCSDLIDYLENSVSLGVQKVRQGSFGAADFLDLGAKAVLVARQFRSLELDQVTKRVVGQIPLDRPHHLSDSCVMEIDRVIKIHNPDMSAEDIPVISTSSETLQQSVQYLQKYGLSGHFLNIADVLRETATGLQSGHLSMQQDRLKLSKLDLEPSYQPRSYIGDGVYRPGEHILFHHVCQKPWYCSKLAEWGNAGVGGALAAIGVICNPISLGIINTSLPGIGIVVDAACAVAVTNPYAFALAISGLLSAILGAIQLKRC